MQVKKRNGELVPFDFNKIVKAVGKVNEHISKDAGFLVSIKLAVTKKAERNGDDIIGIEEIQDAVERGLIELGYIKEAKAYILYREQR